MKSISYGCKSTNGDWRDMHFGAATIPFSRSENLYVLPGLSGEIRKDSPGGLVGNYITKAQAEKIIIKLDSILSRALNSNS